MLAIKKIVRIPTNVNIVIINSLIEIKGPLGDENLLLPSFLVFSVIDNSFIGYLIYNKDFSHQKRIIKKQEQQFKLLAALLKQYLKGVSLGFSKILLFVGIGYNAELFNKASCLSLNLGYSHRIILNIPVNIFIFLPKRNILVIKGKNLNSVSQFTSQIRSLREPGVYKNKGVLYKGEVLFLKEGKKK